MSTFTIPGTLPGMNEITSANRSHRYVGAKQKAVTEQMIGLCAYRMEPVHGPFTVRIEWHEPDLRRDPDNVAAGVKFILDALTKCGLIDGDGRKQVHGIAHEFPPADKHNPRIVVEVTPV